MKVPTTTPRDARIKSIIGIGMMHPQALPMVIAFWMYKVARDTINTNIITIPIAKSHVLKCFCSGVSVFIWFHNTSCVFFVVS